MDDLTIETRPEYPGRWVVMGTWFGVRMPVFEADPSHHPLVQLADCFDYVKALDKRG